MQRRQWLAWAGAGWVLPPTAWGGHSALGPVVPRRLPPELPYTLHDGRQHTLNQLLRGRITAVQLMFTGCSAVCPLQGALFAALQPLVLGGKLKAAQLLSLSIDPLGDDARALTAWRIKFGAFADWRAAVPPLRHGQTLLDFLNARSGKPADAHNAQTFVFDPHGRLAYVCAELAPAPDVATVMAEVARRG